MASLSTLMSAFGVAPYVDGAAMSANQQLSSALADHRGRAEMPAYAMMAESLTSGAFWHSFDEPVATVESWLSLTAGAPPELDDRLFARGELSYSDGEHGSATLRITNGSQDVVCTGLARCVLVGRSGDSLGAIKNATRTKTRNDEPVVVPTVALPAPLDPEMDGRHVMSAIADGRISAGPLAELLGATVASEADWTRMEVAPQDWMANPLGAIQGGVMATIMGQACSFAGQLHTAPGQSYSVADLSIYFFRSPSFDEAVTVVTAPERIGRRLGTVTATMTGAAGVVFARATANIRYR